MSYDAINATLGGSSLKRVRLFRELQRTCQVVVCQLRINQVPFGAVTEVLYNRGL